MSGLVAVGYSASPLVAGIGARALFGVSLGTRFILGGLFGIAGVALIFWPEFAKTTGDRDTLLGAVFTVGSVLLSTVGSLTASRNRSRGLPFWPALGYGMLYGAAAAALLALLQGQSFAPPAIASWWPLVLSRAGRIRSDVRLLPDAAGSNRPRTHRHCRRHDTAAGAGRLDGIRRIQSDRADVRRRILAVGGNESDAAAGLRPAAPQVVQLRSSPRSGVVRCA